MEPNLKKEILLLYEQFKNEDNTKENRLDKWRNLEPQSAELISIIIRCQQSKNVLELGTSNGFSTIWFADALKSTNGKLTTVEIERNRTELAKKNLADFKLTDFVELITADAKDYLEKSHPIFDLVFLDSERKYYTEYWLDLRKLLNKKGSLLVVDNILSHKKEVSEFIALIENDLSLTISILDIGAGLLFVTKE
jgi:predicted O-methyltransferase YrrM